MADYSDTWILQSLHRTHHFSLIQWCAWASLGWASNFHCHRLVVKRGSHCCSHHTHRHDHHQSVSKVRQLGSTYLSKASYIWKCNYQLLFPKCSHSHWQRRASKAQAPKSTVHYHPQGAWKWLGNQWLPILHYHRHRFALAIHQQVPSLIQCMDVHTYRFGRHCLHPTGSSPMQWCGSVLHEDLSAPSHRPMQ